jgi:hypothetical protein
MNMNQERYVSLEELKQFVSHGYTDAQISAILKDRHPGVRGLSERSIKQLREVHDIHPAARTSENETDALVEQVILEVWRLINCKTIC